MASLLKPGEVLQEVQILPRAQARHQPGRETRWREETNVRNRVEQVSRVCIEPRTWFESRGPARDTPPRRPDPWVWEPRTVSRRWNAGSALALAARQGRGPRGRRPDHAGKGITRELVRVSSASGLDNRGSWRNRTRRREPTACPKLPRKGPPPRRVEPSSQTRGRQGRRDQRERAGTPDGP
jgi:hypothetical protein